VVVGDVLRRVPHDKREAVLAMVIKNEKAEQRKPFIMTSAEVMDGFTESPRIRFRDALMRLKSKVVCTFARDISNNHSKQDAARILFADHRGTIPGSGWLPDYLDGLPGLSVNRKNIAAMSEEETAE
jgi:hypothetical protein